MSALLRFQDVTFGYERHPAIHHLSGMLRIGSLTAVVGPNGAGKSTLLKGIVGLLRPLAGRVIAENLTRADIAYLPQQVEIDRSFPISVFDTVQMGHWHTVGAFRGIDGALLDRVTEVISLVGLAGFEQRMIGSLSAGQFQRVLFARMLLQDARLVLLDEPFSAIDARTTTDLLRLIARWHDEGRAVIAVLHDFDQVRNYFPEALLLARELVAWGPTEMVLDPENLRRARAMSEAWDDAAPFCELELT
ncbi:zinc/manganese transport system ATP-binding protein [Gammaproteobacteria bacterium]